MQNSFNFKGKDLTGKWQYGDLVHLGKGCIIVKNHEMGAVLDKADSAYPLVFDMDDFAVVYNNSVGIFIGRTDKINVPIYTNDIVCCSFIMKYINSFGNESSSQMTVTGVVERIGSSFGISTDKGKFLFDALDQETLSILVKGNVYDDVAASGSSASVTETGTADFLQPRYRGKSAVSGKWLYGQLQKIPVTETGSILTVISESHIFSMSEAANNAVVETTVGMSLGHYDINKQEIFAGDILEYEFFSEKGESLLLCRWNDEECRFEFQFLGENTEGFLLPSDIKLWCLRIVGNKTDNPELLEKK